MEKINHWLCRIGIHLWSPWETTEVPMYPISGYDALEDVNDITVETRTRTCERGDCGRGQIKKVLRW